MKKVAVSVLAMALLMLLFAVPVIAEPTKGQKVPTTLVVIPPPIVPENGDSWFTEGGIFHGRGHVEEFSAILIIGSTPVPAVLVEVQDGTWNPQTETLVLNADEVLYVPSKDSPNGFSGKGHIELYDYAWGFPPVFTSHKVFHIWHGFGSYAGQSIMVSYDGPRGVTSTGYCLKG